jgi:hypothetical protein
VFVSTPITIGSLLRLFASNEHSCFDMNMHGRRPFNGTVSCTANVAVFVSNPQLAVEEFAIPSG